MAMILVIGALARKTDRVQGSKCSNQAARKCFSGSSHDHQAPFFYGGIILVLTVLVSLSGPRSFIFFWIFILYLIFIC